MADAVGKNYTLVTGGRLEHHGEITGDILIRSGGILVMSGTVNGSVDYEEGAVLDIAPSAVIRDGLIRV